MSKSKVHIKEWGIYRSHPHADHPWALEGIVTDHPRFNPLTRVTTSSILSPEQPQFSKLKEGDEVETRNTIYILVGNNVNGSN